MAAAEYGYELPPDTAERPRGPDLSPAGIAVLTGRKAVHPRAEKAPSNRQGKKIPEGGCQQDGMLTNSLSSDHDHPADLQAVPPPEQKGLRMGVNRDLGQLFLLLAAVCPVVGAVGIANSTSWPSWNAPARQDRANVLGARSRHILAQFLDATGRTCPKKASARAFTAS
nr:hypothetical protein [Streptomyces barringtoniae]